MRDIRLRGGERGVTLIELVISIVIIAIAASAVLGVLSSSVGRSADAMVMSQAVSIAEAYLEEVTLKPFADPDGTDGESGRTNFDDVDDYNGLVDVGARDQFDNPIAALSQYTVAVTVASSGALPGVPAADAERVDVRVSYAPNVTMILSGYKTRL
jgi:MSHA pilin protein MshD